MTDWTPEERARIEARASAVLRSVRNARDDEDAMRRVAVALESVMRWGVKDVRRPPATIAPWWPTGGGA